MSARPLIGPKEIRSIKTVQNRLGLDDTTYRDILREVAGVDSCKKLGYDGYIRVMKHFRELGREYGVEVFVGRSGGSRMRGYRRPISGRRVGGKPGEKVEMATPEQQAKICALWEDVARIKSIHAMFKFISRRFGVLTWDWMTKETAAKVIEALKDMKVRKQREAST